MPSAIAHATSATGAVDDFANTAAAANAADTTYADRDQHDRKKVWAEVIQVPVLEVVRLSGHVFP